MELVRPNQELWNKVISRWNNTLLEYNYEYYEIIGFDVYKYEMEALGAENIINYIKSMGWKVVGFYYDEDPYMNDKCWSIKVKEDYNNRTSFHEILPDIKFSTDRGENFYD